MGTTAATLQSPRRRNVSPTTSILHTFVEDCDCTGTDFDKTPEDGQMIVVVGKTGFAADTYTFADNTLNNVTQAGASLRMVWGSALRSDRSALGQKRVPVFKKGAIRVKTKLFYVDNVAAAPSANGYIPGALVSVRQVGTSGDADGNALQGANTRMVPCPLDYVTGASGSAAHLDNAWVIGHVERVTNDIVGNGAEVEIFLYETPRLITEGGAADSIATATTLS